MKQLLALSAVLVLSSVGLACEDDPPNFVFLLADDLGWRDLGCQGSDFYETPNIDRLAAEGVRFTQAYAACPVCSPTRASILAGKYPARMHTTDYFGGRRKQKLLPAEYIEQLPLEEVTLAEALKEAGYATGFFGKWHLGREGFGPRQQGFDINVGGFWRGHPPAGYFSPYKNPELPDGPEGEHLTERLTAEALAFIDQHREGPFLLYLSYYAVHTPLQTKPELKTEYERKAQGLPPSEAPRFLPEGEREARQVQDHPVYAGMIETLDDSVGRVLERLDQHGLAGNTIVIFFSDNGGLSTSEGSPTSNVPLRAGKGWLYEGGIREPLILRWPEHFAAGRVVTEPVTSTDFYPTLLELAGLPARPTQHVDGRSFAPRLREDTDAPDRPLFWHYPHYGNQGGSPGGAVRLGRYKLIEFFEDMRVELYDLEADIGEQHDLAAAQPDLAQDLRQRLHAWRTEVDARMPSPNPEWRQER